MLSNDHEEEETAMTEEEFKAHARIVKASQIISRMRDKEWEQAIADIQKWETCNKSLQEEDRHSAEMRQRRDEAARDANRHIDLAIAYKKALNAVLVDSAE